MDYITKELFEWTDAQSERLEKVFPSDTPREEMYGRVVKLTEEVGELADAVAGMFKHQRKEKQDYAENDAVALEVADVLITTLLLAYKAGVDVNDALTKKIRTINERFENITNMKS